MDSESRPVAGVDYPRTFQEMDQWFRDDAACREYIRRLRWRSGFICPHWWSEWRALDDVGPAAPLPELPRSHVAHRRHHLRGNAQACGLVHGMVPHPVKNGVSALGRRVLGLGSYETAWTAAQAAPGVVPDKAARRRGRDR
jgi:hypothetical protein